MAKRRKPGEGSVHLRADGRWEGRFVVGYDEKGLPKTRNVLAKTKGECLEKLKALKEQVGPVPKEQAAPDMTFGEWLDFWYRTYSLPNIRPGTQENYERRIYQHIIPHIGKIPLKKLAQSDLQKFYGELKETGRLKFTDIFGPGLSDRMIRTCHSLCKRALQKAVDEKMIPSNPAAGCKLPPAKAKEMQILTSEEMQRFLIQAKYDGYYEIFLLALATGLRRGELLALQWNDLNFQTRELTIRRHVRRTKGQLLISEPKTDAGIRTITLPHSVVQVLKEHKEKTDSRWMFPSPVKKDSPRDPGTLYSKMRLVLERAGCKVVRLHDLRHTFATRSLEHGMDIKTLSTIIGHVSVATTLNIYTHVTDTMQRQAAANIDRGIAGKEPQKIEEPQITSPLTPFEPTKGKYRKPGTGCISKINDHLWEGKFAPKWPDGKKRHRNVYGHTEEECEEKLAEMIRQTKAEIDAEKERLRAKAS